MLKIPSNYKEIAEVMTNLDHSVKPWAAEKLKNGDVYGQYSGWDFCGFVWYAKELGKFCCRVDQHRVHVDTVIEDTLEAIMETVCEKYGRS